MSLIDRIKWVWNVGLKPVLWPPDVQSEINKALEKAVESHKQLLDERDALLLERNHYRDKLETQRKAIGCPSNMTVTEFFCNIESRIKSAVPGITSNPGQDYVDKVLSLLHDSWTERHKAQNTIRILHGTCADYEARIKRFQTLAKKRKKDKRK